jgi:PAS domain S-box-containing protein
MKAPSRRVATTPKPRRKAAPRATDQSALRRLIESQERLRDAQERLFAAHRVGREQTLRLQQSRRRYAELFNLAPVGYITLSGQGWVQEANETSARMLGLRRAFLVRSLFLRSVARDDYGVFTEHLRACQDSVVPIVTELRLCRKDGAIFPVQMITAPAAATQDHEYLTAIVDLSELLDTQAELRAARDDLEARVKERTAELQRANESLSSELAHRARLEAAILDVSERERRRFGQDLHDETCQTLGGLSLLAASMAREFQKLSPAYAERMEAFSQELSTLITQTRNIARNAHPVAIGGGLKHALKELAQRIRPRLPCTVLANVRAELPEDVALALYRIAQEATANCLKHARASRVEIRLESSQSGLVLSIEDDGCGLSHQPSEGACMGLDIMGYRARAIGGNLVAQRLPKGGTRVSCFFPWPGEARGGKVSGKPQPTRRKKPAGANGRS